MLVAQSCPALCDPRNWEPPGPSVHGILQARILEWVAIPLLRGNLPAPGIKPGSPALQADSLPSEGKPHALQVLSRFSRVQLFATLWTIACQALYVHGILQTRILEWVALPFSRGSSWPRDQIRISYISCIGSQVFFLCVCVCVCVCFFFTTSTTWKASYLPWGQCKTPFRFFPD